MMFFAMFLPLGARWSVDEALTPPKTKREPAVFSFASAALLLQVCLMYWFTALLKSGHAWHRDGTAVEYAVRIEQFAKPLGVWLRGYPELLRYLTWGTWWLESVGPFLLFSPLLFLPLRLLGIAGFWGLHFGLYNCMELGVFPFISTAAMLAFIPAEAWEFLAKKIPLDRWRNGAYSAATRHRTFFNMLGLRPPDRDVPAWADRLAGFFFVLAIWWGAITVKSWNVPSVPALDWIGNITGINETWDMFAPYPLRDDGWFVIPGKLEDGSDVDVYNRVEKPVSWDQPERVAATYPDDRWRSFMMNLWGADYEKYRLYYARWLCRTWNEGRPEGKRLASFEIDFMEKYVRLPPRESTTKKVDLWEHECFDKDEAPAAAKSSPASEDEPDS
jgi:hypothetical protein